MEKKLIRDLIEDRHNVHAYEDNEVHCSESKKVTATFVIFGQQEQELCVL